MNKIENFKIRNITNDVLLNNGKLTIKKLKEEIEELKRRNEEIKTLPFSQELKNEEEFNIIKIKNKQKDIMDVIDSTYFIKGVDGIIELIKQRALILTNELWWDINYGVDLYSLDEVRATFWIREVISEIKYIKNIRDINIVKEDNTYKINVNLILINNEELKSDFHITF